jgi:hypothetical protein
MSHRDARQCDSGFQMISRGNECTLLH